MLNVAYKLFGKLKRMENNSIGDILWLAKASFKYILHDIVGEMRIFFSFAAKRIDCICITWCQKQQCEKKPKGRAGRESE